jgi:hypothetical protein
MKSDVMRVQRHRRSGYYRKGRFVPEAIVVLHYRKKPVIVKYQKLPKRMESKY